MLKRIDPETDLQRKALESAEREFRNVIEAIVDESIEDFFTGYSKDDIINKPSGDWYNEYLQFCTDFDYEPVSQNQLTKLTQRQYNVNCKVVKINDKSVRVFK